MKDWTTIFLILCLPVSCIRTSGKSYDPVTADIGKIDDNNPPAIHEITIAQDNVQLTGFILTANGLGPHPTVILLHGYPGTEKNLDLAQSLRRAGFNVLFFHYRGAWGSEGKFSFLTIANDVAAALTFVRDKAADFRIDTNHISLVGHSLGAHAAIQGTANDDHVICAVGMSTVNLGGQANHFASDDTAKENFKTYTDELFMLRGFDGEQALAELRANKDKLDLRNDGADLSGRSVLLVIGENDKIVPRAAQETLANSFREIKGLTLSTHTIPGDHSFSTNRIQLQHAVVNWIMEHCR